MIFIYYILGIPLVFAGGAFIVAKNNWGWLGYLAAALIAFNWPHLLVVGIVAGILYLIALPFIMLGRLFRN